MKVNTGMKLAGAPGEFIHWQLFFACKVGMRSSLFIQTGQGSGTSVTEQCVLLLRGEESGDYFPPAMRDSGREGWKQLEVLLTSRPFPLGSGERGERAARDMETWLRATQSGSGVKLENNLSHISSLGLGRAFRTSCLDTILCSRYPQWSSRKSSLPELHTRTGHFIGNPSLAGMQLESGAYQSKTFAQIFYICMLLTNWIFFANKYIFRIFSIWVFYPENVICYYSSQLKYKKPLI